MSRAWRHLDVTHVPLVIQVRDLFFIKSQKMIFFTLKQCAFLDFRGCEGSGACFERLRMRSRSRRKCAHRNAGDLESSLEVCACVYDPIHVTTQGKSLGPNCACVQPPRHYRGLPMNACVLYPMGSREFYDHIWALKRHLGHMTYMLDSDWLKKFLLRSDWLPTEVALYTTDILICGLLDKNCHRKARTPASHIDQSVTSCCHISFLRIYNIRYRPNLRTL